MTLEHPHFLKINTELTHSNKIVIRFFKKSLIFGINRHKTNFSLIKLACGYGFRHQKIQSLYLEKLEDAALDN